MYLNLTQEKLDNKHLWEQLKIVLDGVDADFSGANGEEYYAENNKSHFENAVEIAKKMTHTSEGIEYVLEKCKKYSSDYYSDFVYSAFYIGNDMWLVSIATTQD